MMAPKILFILFFLFIFPFTQSQLSEKEEKQIDSIFAEWNKTNKPGMAAGLLYGEQIQYLKGFGTANLQTKKAIDPRTKFQIDHLSRQFTIMSVLLLEEMGKLSLDDPIQKYITELPRYQHKLTIQHLVNHSSGLNDYDILKLLLGKEENNIFTHEDAMHLISTQNTLNFIPGTQFSYLTSKTETTLLAEIIAKASGESLAVFASENIFTPLQMTNTIFLEDYNNILQNVAYSYQSENEIFKKKILNLSNIGPTNLYTSAEDLLLWYKKLTQVLDKTSTLDNLIKELDRPVRLNDGSTYNSSWGQMTLGRSFYHLERGLPTYWQYGRVGGYGTNVFRFPQQNLTSFVMGNNDSYNGMPAMMMAVHFLEDKFPQPREVDLTKIKSRKTTTSELKKYEGYYWNAKRALARRFFVEADTLRYSRPEQDIGLATVPLDKKNSFQLKVESDDIIVFTFSEENGEVVYDIKSGIGTPYRYKKYNPIKYSSNELKQFTGNFYIKALNCVYSFNIEKDSLTLHGPGNQIVSFFPVTKDIFRSNAIQFGSITFKRNSEEKIIGFQIDTDGIQKLFLTKIID